MTDLDTPPASADAHEDPSRAPGFFAKILSRIDTTNAIVLPLLAFASALVIGTLVIALSDIDKLKTGDIGGILTTIKDAYIALPQGAFDGWRALNETIVATTPLLLAGLAVAVTFKAGLFNIGGTGQMLIGAHPVQFRRTPRPLRTTATPEPQAVDLRPAPIAPPLVYPRMMQQHLNLIQGPAPGGLIRAPGQKGIHAAPRHHVQGATDNPRRPAHPQIPATGRRHLQAPAVLGEMAIDQRKQLRNLVGTQARITRVEHHQPIHVRPHRHGIRMTPPVAVRHRTLAAAARRAAGPVPLRRPLPAEQVEQDGKVTARLGGPSRPAEQPLQVWNRRQGSGLDASGQRPQESGHHQVQEIGRYCHGREDNASALHVGTEHRAAGSFP